MNKKKENTEELKAKAALLEMMRADVLELEIKARKWKAEYEIMLYMMEADKITPQYQEFMKAKKESIDKIAAQLGQQSDVEDSETKVVELKPSDNV